MSEIQTNANNQALKQMVSPVETPPRQVSPLPGGIKCYEPGIHLGKIIGPDGWGAGHVDDYETPILQAGFTVGVGQASHGPTTVFVRPHEGYVSEAMTVDETTGAVAWQGPRAHDPDQKVMVHFSHGKTSKLGIDWLQDAANLGEEGPRGGVVRTTDTEGNCRYFVVAANFQGEPDDWYVERAVVEIEPASIEGLATGGNPQALER